MAPSLLVKVREISDETSLSVLGHFGEGVESSCKDERATQVYLTSHTNINCVNDDKYISPHNYAVSYSKSKL